MRTLLQFSKKSLFWKSAHEFKQYLHQNAASRLEPWQQEILDYLRFGRMPTLFARNNLAAWVRRHTPFELNAGAPAPPSKRAIRSP